MPNDYYPPTTFYFEVKVDEETSAFTEVSGISKEINIEEVSEGGENRFKYRLPTQAIQQNLTLKRGLLKINSGLLKWCRDSINDGLSAAITPKAVVVSLLDENGKSQMQWVFHNAYPIKYTISDLKSMESEAVVESIELAYTYFESNPAKA